MDQNCYPHDGTTFTAIQDMPILHFTVLPSWKTNKNSENLYSDFKINLLNRRFIKLSDYLILNDSTVGMGTTNLPTTKVRLTLSWRRPLSYRNQSIDLRSKSMDWFLYHNGLRHERVKSQSTCPFQIKTLKMFQYTIRKRAISVLDCNIVVYILIKLFDINQLWQ